MNRTLRDLATLAILALAVTACGDNGQIVDPDPTPLAVTLTPDNLQMTVGETAELTVGITGGPANVSASISCESSSTSVVTTAASGNACVVEAVGAGSATVTANVQQGEQQASATASVSVEDEPGPEPSAVLVVSGDGQSLPPGGQSQSLIVRVEDQFGDPFPGAEVAFSAGGAEHSLSATSGVTNDDGEAFVTVTAGQEPGTITVVAAVEGAGSATFTLTVEAPEAATVERVSGDGQTLGFDETSQGLVVRVDDQFGNPFQGADVGFTGSGAAHTLSTGSVTTDASGEAAITLTSGTEEGEITVEATVAGVGSVTFTLEVEVGAEPTAILAVDGDAQTLGFAQTSAALTVRVEDEFGNPFQGAEVQFSGSGAAHTLSATTGTTDVLGQASVSVTTGTEAGTITVEAEVAGVGSVTFTLTVEEDPDDPAAAAIVEVSGNNQTLGHNETSAELVVQVNDQFDDPFPGAEVTFSGSGVAHTLSSTSETTDGSGQASITVTAGTEDGTITVEAEVAGVGSVTFTLTVEDDPADPEAAAIVQVSGNNQTLDHNETSAELVVQVNDQFDDPFPGAEVTFSGSGVAHGLSSPSETTDGSGQASITVTAGTEDGVITVEAEVAGVGSVPFTLTVEESGPAPTPVTTDFSEYATGAFPNDWTDRGLEAGANSITVESANGDNVLRIDLPDQSPSLHRGISWDQPGTPTDVRVEATLVPQDAGGSDVPAYITARGTADGTYYRLQIRNRSLLELAKVVGGSPTVPIPDGDTGFSYDASDTVHLELEIVGDQLRGRAWLDGQPKPTTWMVEVTDDDISSGGWTGLGRLHEGVTDFLSFTVTPMD